MSLFIKFAVLLVAAAALYTALKPNSDVGQIVSAAMEDVGSFCDRQPEACHQGAQIAYRTSDLVAAALRALQPDEENGSGAQMAEALTSEDLALSPSDTAADLQQPVFATHGATASP